MKMVYLKDMTSFKVSLFSKTIILSPVFIILPPTGGYKYTNQPNKYSYFGFSHMMVL